MATSVEEEWSVLGGWVDTIVVGKLQHWQVLVPIIMQGVNKVAQHLFNGAIGTLRLTACLRVVAGGDVELGTQVLEDGLPEVGGEPWVTIGDDGGGKAMEPVDLPDEETSITNRVNRLVGWDEVALLSETIHKGEDGVKASGSSWESSDEIQRHRLPGCSRNGQRLQLAGLQCM